MHHNSPFPSYLNAYADFADRFWYWRGKSGRQYIHSVYTPKSCPPLPSGCFIAVQRRGDVRRAMAVGLFNGMFDPVTMELNLPAAQAADELHVHLLARNPADAETVVSDLIAGIDADLSLPQAAFEAHHALLSSKARAA